MKKYASIFLLSVMVFNMVGYRAWFFYAEMKSDARMEAQLDADQYKEQDLIAINIPLNNPYQLEQKNFQRIDGEVSFQGNTYRYVKRRVSDGFLTILCLPDAHKTVLKKARNEYGNTANGMAGNSKNSRGTFKKNINVSEADSKLARFQLPFLASVSTLQHTNRAYQITKASLTPPEQPPRNQA